MAKKIFDTSDPKQLECPHNTVKLKAVQKVGSFRSNDYECEACGIAIQTDGIEDIDKKHKAKIDEVLKNRSDKQKNDMAKRKVLK